jgi:propionate CoA-transferase
LTLIEVAPGIDVERDVIAHMAFRPAIADDIAEMDRCVFAAGTMNLADRYREMEL